MGNLRTDLMIHSRHPAVACALCGTAWEQHYVGAVLLDGDEMIGDVCPRCLHQEPRHSADIVRGRAAQLQLYLEQLTNSIDRVLPRNVPREPAELQALAARYEVDQRELRALAERMGREFAGLRDVIDQNCREEVAAQAPALQSRKEFTERRERYDRIVEHFQRHAQALLALADRMAGQRSWPTKLSDLVEVERFLFWQRFPGIRPEDLHRLVDKRYHDFLGRAT